MSVSHSVHTGEGVGVGIPGHMSEGGGRDPPRPHYLHLIVITCSLVIPTPPPPVLTKMYTLKFLTVKTSFLT